MRICGIIAVGSAFSISMTICDLQRGDRALVQKVELEGELREKLLSLQIHAGARLTVLKVSPFRRVFVVQAGSSRLALGREVAGGVRIWKI